MLEEEKTKKKKEEELKKKKEQEQERLENFYPPFKNPLDFVQYLEVDRIIGQISNEMKNFSLQNHRKQDNKYDVSQIRTLSRISKTLFDLKVNIDFINSKKNNLDLLQEFRTNNNCTLNMSNDLNCGCAGIDNKCFIF